MANTFEYQPYRSPFAGSIAELMAHQNDPQARAAEQIGQAQARAAEISGNAWGQAAQGIGQQISGQIQQLTDPRQKEARLKAGELEKQIGDAKTVDDLIKRTPLVDMGNGLKGYDLPAMTAAIAAKGGDPSVLVAHVQPVNSALEQFHAGRIAVVQTGAKAVQAGGNSPVLAGSFIDLLEQNNVVTTEQAAQYRQFATTPENVAKLTALYAGPQKFAPAAPGSGVLNETTGHLVPGESVPDKPVELRPGSSLVNPGTGGVIATQPGNPVNVPAGGTLVNPSTATPLFTAPPAATANEWKDVLLDGKPAKVFVDPKTKTVTTLGGQVVDNPDTRIKPVPTQTTIVNQQGRSDAQSIADAIESGQQPPDTKGLYRLGGPVRAELAKRGYDLTTANLDWQATKKHLSTLNGAQQTRLRQAISTASDSLGVIEDLAKQWDGGKFPILNKANLALALNGAKGPEAQQIATKLTAQITDVTSELGNVYMGGNSPTDHALSLAGKNLSADWTRDQLLSAIKLARTNLQIRSNSILNSGAITSSSTGAPTTPQPTGRFNPATGKVEPIGAR